MSSPTKLRQMSKELGWPPELEKAADQLQKLKRENAALREDKERLDWLLTGDGGFWVNWMYEKDEWTPELKASRDAIDACRNGRIGREKP